MVLVQEDDELHEHVIYYLSQNLVGPELNYSHVEKLALACRSRSPTLTSLYITLQDYGGCQCQSISIRPY
jgi:hypothetical protein